MVLFFFLVLSPKYARLFPTATRPFTERSSICCVSILDPSPTLPSAQAIDVIPLPFAHRASRATPRRRSTPCSSPRLRSLPCANQTGANTDGVTPGFRTPCSVPSDGQLPTTLGRVDWFGWRRLVIWLALMRRCLVRVGCRAVLPPRSWDPRCRPRYKEQPRPSTSE
ncbi:hypothetical protein BDV11DRAFT_18702 [Aspergillus similis]